MSMWAAQGCQCDRLPPAVCAAHGVHMRAGWAPCTMGLLVELPLFFSLSSWPSSWVSRLRAALEWTTQPSGQGCWRSCGRSWRETTWASRVRGFLHVARKSETHRNQTPCSMYGHASPAAGRRALLVLHYVIKELASKRLAADQRVFEEVTGSFGL